MCSQAEQKRKGSRDFARSFISSMNAESSADVVVLLFWDKYPRTGALSLQFPLHYMMLSCGIPIPKIIKTMAPECLTCLISSSEFCNSMIPYVKTGV